MTALSISLLGSFEAALDNEPLTQFRTKSVQALFIYLVCEAKRPHQREALMTLLWPSMPLESAQANLRQTLYRLRKLIPEVKGKNGVVVPFLDATRQTIQVNPDADYYLDADTVAVSEPSEAIALYRGDFLADFYLPDSEPFEEWAASRRADYRRQVLEMLERETAALIQQTNYHEAIKLAQRQLEIDNLRENSHRQLMEALARNGRRQESLTHYNHLRQLLQDELAIEPEPETMTLVEAIRAGELSRTATVSTYKAISPEKGSTKPKHNLPQPLTSFIGRKREMAAVIDLIGQHRLVMLTGVGGIGKTNLSLQVGRQILDTFPDGVWLVELAPLSDPALIPQTAVSALGLAESSDRPMMETLLNYLREKSCLLILDNCEHLINAAAQFVQTLLQSCPNLKVLASSREALAVPGEVPFHVPSLSFPDSAQNVPLDELGQYDAVRLFMERASAVLPAFRVTADNIEPLIQICRRLDGIPLALELAAARVRILTLAQIAERLDDRFRLLTGGSRTAFPRQQTLRALIDWSWDLLNDLEQLLLQRLSVFAGGMSLEAVEAVCAGDNLDTYEILDLLNELVNKSLVIAHREQGQETRYHLLETIRQYSQEKLAASGQAETFRQHHLAYFRQFAEGLEPVLMRSKQGVWLNRLERELDNIRAALLWAQETDIEAGLALVSSLGWFCWARGYWHEMESQLSQLLSKPTSLPPVIKAKALFTQGLFYLILYQRDQACVSLFEKSLTLYREIGDPVGTAGALRYLGYVLTQMGEVDQGKLLMQESLALLRPLGNKVDIAETLTLLGEQETWNNREKARTYFQESESLSREVGEWGRLSWTLGKAGVLAMEQEDYEAARFLFEESLTLQETLRLREGAYTLYYQGLLYNRLGDYPSARITFEKILSLNQGAEFHGSVLLALVELGYVYLRLGEPVQAQHSFIKSLRQFKKLDIRWWMVNAAEGLARVAVNLGQAETAVRLIAWVDALRQATNLPRGPVEQADMDREMAAIREMLNAETFTALYTEGQAMTMEQAIALAVKTNKVSTE